MSSNLSSSPNLNLPALSNNLSKETSPYLLQHAHNPVHWQAWSNEIFTLAQQHNKPILLSIGYAACHWCHVMERESFEQEEVGAYMNAHFINVKVDREERPDVDHIYMDALQAMTGSGGWPLNIFLLPDGKPFYGGTYFPPIKMPQRASWMEVLRGVKEAYENNIDQLQQQANQLTQHIVGTNMVAKNFTQDTNEVIATKDEVALLAQRILQSADTQWGGFGNAPKFPQTFCLQMLLRNYAIHKDDASVVHAIRSIDKMIQGGIYDHVGGGFSRYSTDAQWQAPHFEKMLYDNALLLGILSEAYQITHKEIYRKVIDQTFDFLQRELFNGEGAYYAALDADSEGVEGKFYTWSYEEIKNSIPFDHDFLTTFCTYYQVSKEGNWEHTNILWTQDEIEKGFSEKWVEAKNYLLAQRSLRIRPALDHKIILSWNNLMISALCKCYAALGNENYKNRAIENMHWIENNFMDHSASYLFHANTNGDKKIVAFLDDYASLIKAYIDLQEITGDLSYLHKAKKWAGYVLENFIDEELTFFYYTPKYQTDIIVRKKETYDGAQPSGNAMMCWNLNYLGSIFQQSTWTTQAQKMISLMRKMILQYPSSFAFWGQSFAHLAMDQKELVGVGPHCEDYRKQVLAPFLPFKSIILTPQEEATILSTKGRYSIDNQYYICNNNTCLPPISQLSDILALI
jgi:uncharacterized protein YyaL (SSP411 family)